MLPSTIFLTSERLMASNGDSITLGDYGLISTASVGTYENGATPMLELENYNQLTPNLLLNGEFSSGDTTNWTVSGSAVVSVGTYPGLTYQLSLNNISQISQNISGLAGKHPIFTFYHQGQEAICSIELRDGSNNLIASQNRIFPKTDNYLKCSMGFYNDSSLTPVTAIINVYSDNDGCILANCKFFAVDSYSSIGIGDDYNQNKSVISFSGKKLFFGNNLELISARPEGVDFRTDTYIKGNLLVTGTISSGPIFGSIGTQSWVSNIIFTSGSQTQISFTSGVLQLISGLSFGINSGNSGTMSQITYLYLDSDVSTSNIQITTSYNLVIGANKIFIGTCYPGTTGYASFVSQSNSLPLINASDLITPFSIVNGNLSINSVQAQNISVTNLQAVSGLMGTLSIDNLLTMKETTSAITIGLTGTLPTSSVNGTGIWLDRSGIYSLSSNVQQATLSSAGLSSANGNFIANANGLFLTVPLAYAPTNALNFTNGGVVEGSVGLFDDGLFSAAIGIGIDGGINGLNVSRTMSASIGANSKSNSTASCQLYASRETGLQPQITLTSSVSQGTIILNDLHQNVDVSIQGDTDLNLLFCDASVDNIGIGTNLPASKLHISQGALTMEEIVVPSAPSANNGVLYLVDNGAGKTQLAIRFNTGAVQILATQP